MQAIAREENESTSGCPPRTVPWLTGLPSARIRNRLYIQSWGVPETPLKQELSIDTIARECIGMRLRLVNRVVTRIYDAALRQHGLKTSQVNIMVAAWKLGVASPGRVCEVLDLDPSTLSRPA